MHNVLSDHGLYIQKIIYSFPAFAEPLTAFSQMPCEARSLKDYLMITSAE